MGSDQSRTAGDKEEVEGPLDYYELLQVDVEATPEEIKVSLRLERKNLTDATRNHTVALPYVQTRKSYISSSDTLAY